MSDRRARILAPPQSSPSPLPKGTTLREAHVPCRETDSWRSWEATGSRWFCQNAHAWRALLCVFLACSFTSAWGNPSVRLSWLLDSDPAVAGYRVHYGTSSGQYTSVVDAWTNATISISGLTPGEKYYFVVAGYNIVGIEGPHSAEVSFVVPTSSGPNPLAPQINVVSPASAAPGTQVSLHGVNFSATTAVQFGGVNATFVVASDTLLMLTVPPGAISGQLTIYAQTGTASVQFTILAVVSPANDNFANAQWLAGAEPIAFASTVNAGKEPNEPNHAGNPGGSSIWYRWTAPADGTWSLNAAGSTFNALLAVYTGNSLVGLSVVASNQISGGFAPSLAFKATRGAVYDIAVDGVNGATGDAALQLVPSASIVFSNGFQSTEGFASGTPLAGQNGWLGSQASACGIANNALANFAQSAYLGFPSTALAGSALTLYHPLNYNIDVTNHPVIQFSVTLQLKDFLNLYHDTFGWAVRNSAGHQLFAITFDNSLRTISYRLDNAAGPVSTGIFYDNTTIYTLVVIMDFSRNLWNASLSGTVLASRQPMTTTGAALTLGDIDATAVFQNLALPGLDGMLFDNYVVTAGPNPTPKIWTATGNQTVTAGADVSLGVVATGSAPLTYQWYLNNTAIPASVSPSLVLKNVTPGQSGNYSVVVSNPNGSVSAQSVVTITTATARARLSTPALSNGQAVLNLGLAIGNDYTLQVSTNLVDWTTLGEFHADGTNAMVCDPGASLYSSRFYRVVSP